MAASTVPTANLTALYTNTTGGTPADPAVMDNAIIDIVATINTNAGEMNANAAAVVLPHADGSVTAAKLASSSVETAKIASLAVTTAKLAEASVTLSKMAANSVGTSQLVDSSVTAAKVMDGVLTAAKFVAGALTNETQNGLRVTALEAETVTGFVNMVNGFDADNTGATSSESAIESALASLSADGGTLFFENGTYDIGAITIAQDNVRILGDIGTYFTGSFTVSEGLDDICFSTFTFLNGVITFAGTEADPITNIKVENVNYEQTNSTDILLRLTCITDGIIDNVHINRSAGGGRALYLVKPHNLKISNYTARGNLKTGVNLLSESLTRHHKNVLFENCYVERDAAYVGDIDHGYYLHGFENLTMINCQATGFTNGSASYDFKIRDCLGGTFIRCKAVQFFLPSYANTGVFLSTKNVVLQDCIGNVLAFQDGGSFTGCRINNLDGTYVQTSVINDYGMVLSGFITGIAKSNRGLVGMNAFFMSDVGTDLSTGGFKLYNCYVAGSIYNYNRSGNILMNCHVVGDVYFKGTTSTSSQNNFITGSRIEGLLSCQAARSYTTYVTGSQINTIASNGQIIRVGGIANVDYVKSETYGKHVILTPDAAANAVNNNFFVDSTDNLLKFKDNGGTLRVVTVV